jgi:hypothetical protein
VRANLHCLFVDAKYAPESFQTRFFKLGGSNNKHVQLAAEFFIQSNLVVTEGKILNLLMSRC